VDKDSYLAGWRDCYQQLRPAPAGLDAAKSRMRAAVYGDGDVPKWFDDCIEGIVRAAARPAEDAG
jgi:hypothetical protein